MRAGWAVMCALCSIGATLDEGTRVRVLILAPQAAPQTAVAVLARPTGYADSADVRRELSAQATRGETEFRLPAGSWTLQAAAPGFWSPPTPLVIETAAPESPIVLRMWPAGGLTGRIVVSDAKRMPEAIRVGLESTPSEKSRNPERAIPSTTIECPVREGAWTCELPAGRLDVQLRARSFVPLYVWDVDVAHGRPLDLGTHAFRSGASVAGFVTMPDGTVPGPIAMVELATPDGEPIVSSRGTGTEEPTFGASVNHRGFFQIGGVPPADYLLTARSGELHRDSLRIRVLPDLEARPAQPLVLRAPVVLDVVVSPSVDPSGHPWRIQLMGAGRQTHIVEQNAMVGEDGRWRREGLSPGPYRIVLSGTGDTRWYAGELEVDADSGPHQIDIAVVHVGGTVRLGKDPLAASVTFGGSHGAVKIPFEADDDGQFAGFLPRGGDWDVDVEADDPPVRRTLSVEVAEDGKVDIALPRTALSGVVEDESGRPLPAIVDAQRIDDPEFVQTRSNADGRFELEGLPPGGYLLSARGRSEAGESFESAQVPLTLDEDSEPTFARLVARLSLVLKGQILSREGPVPGAHIKPVAVQAPLAAVPILRADGDGRFEFRLPPATSEIGLSVGALGYAVRILRMPVAVDRPATVLLERLGGKLVLEIPEIPKGGPGVVVAHGGFYESVSYLSGWAAANGGGQNEMGQMVIPQLEPGRYAACISTVPDLPGLSKGVLPQDGCAQGTLSAGGELILKVPAPLAPSGSPR